MKRSLWLDVIFGKREKVHRLVRESTYAACVMWC